MKGKKKTRDSLAGKHPIAQSLIIVIVSVILVMIVAFVIEILLSLLVMAVGNAEGADVFSTLKANSTAITLVAYAIVLVLFWLKSRKKLNGFFNTSKMGYGILLAGGELAICVFILIAGAVSHMTYGSFGKALLMAAQPGVSEEVLWRIIPIAIAMRSKYREKLVVPIVVITSIGFGLLHGVNIFAGADPVTTIFQVIYAIGIGLVYSAIYIRTGNPWITIILHSLMDFVSFIGVDMQNSNGILTQGVNAVGAVVLLIYAAIYFVNAFIIFRKDKRVDIAKTWERIWKVEPQAQE